MSNTNYAIVTGGSSGIGYATGRLLMLEGFRVSLWARQRTKGEAAATRLNSLNLAGEACFVEVDVGDAASVARARDQVAKENDHVGVLVNAAGVMHRRALGSLDAKEVEEDLRANLLGTLLVTNAAVLLLAACGDSTIVNVASVAGRESFPGLAAYGAAKAGVVHFTRTAAKELLPDGIRVVCVCPGVVDTPLHERSTLEALGRSTPRQRLQTPDEIADIIVHLTRESSRSINGAVIDADDGLGLFAGGVAVRQHQQSKAAVTRAPIAARPTASPERAQVVPPTGASGPADAVHGDLAEKLAAVFVETFGVRKEILTMDSGPRDVPKWDSVGQIRLVANTEKAFSVTFEVDEIMEFSTFGAIVMLLQKHGLT